MYFVHEAGNLTQKYFFGELNLHMPGVQKYEPQASKYLFIYLLLTSRIQIFFQKAVHKVQRHTKYYMLDLSYVPLLVILYEKCFAL